MYSLLQSIMWIALGFRKAWTIEIFAPLPTLRRKTVQCVYHNTFHYRTGLVSICSVTQLMKCWLWLLKLWHTSYWTSFLNRVCLLLLV